MLISYLSEIINHISKFIKLPPLVFIGAVGLFVFLCALALQVIHKLRSINKELIEVNRSLYILGQRFKHPAASIKGKKVVPYEMDVDLDEGNKPKIKLQKQTQGHQSQEDSGRQSYRSGGEARKLTAEAKNVEIEEQGLSEKWKSNPDIKRKIIDQLRKTGRPISYHDITRQLSLVYPDYDSALKELDQLEKEGEIEGHLGAGKLYYKINH